MVNKKAIFSVCRLWLFIFCIGLIAFILDACVKYSPKLGIIVIAIGIFITASIAAYIGYCIENSTSDNEPS